MLTLPDTLLLLLLVLLVPPSSSSSSSSLIIANQETTRIVVLQPAKNITNISKFSHHLSCKHQLSAALGTISESIERQKPKTLQVVCGTLFGPRATCSLPALTAVAYFSCEAPHSLADTGDGGRTNIGLKKKRAVSSVFWGWSEQGFALSPGVDHGNVPPPPPPPPPTPFFFFFFFLWGGVLLFGCLERRAPGSP